jgi:hypothetical protein
MPHTQFDKEGFSRFRPIVAVVVVLAVGVTGAIVGSAFAAGQMVTDETVTAETETQTVPVLEPVGHGPEAPDPNPDGDENTLDVSRAVAEQQVPVGESSGLDPLLSKLLDDLATSADPGALLDTVTALGTGEEDEAGETDAGGDPCAPADGEPAAECPSGIGGTVLALRAAPHPSVVGTANPPTYEDSLHKLYYCDPQEHRALDLPFVAVSNVPATIAVSYWPTSEPDAVSTFTLETSATARTEWERSFEAGEPFGEWTQLQHCTVIEGLERGVAYRFRLDSVDTLGGEATFTSGFSLPDRGTRPPTRVLPIGDNVVFVTMAHAAAETVEFTGYVLEPGAEADCTRRPGRLEAVENMRTEAVSAAQRERHGYHDRYTKRSSQSFWVPEGSTIAVCLASYLDDRPSYSWAQANYRHQEVLHSPDRTLPTISLERVDLVRTVGAEAVKISARTRDALGCGTAWEGPSRQGRTVPASDLRDAVICSIDNLGGLVGLSTSSGDVVITSVVTQGEAVTWNQNLLPLGPEACRGVCATPETSWYRISLATIQVPDGICGSGFGDCDPPTREHSAGTALLKVEWEQGAQNGLSEWGRTAPVAGQPAVLPPPDYPQMDTREEITVTRIPGFYGADASFLLATDRPVTYTARLRSACELPGSVTEVSGRSEGRTLVRFHKLCLGESHGGQVELTDDTGAVSTYNVTPGDNLWPSGAIGVGVGGDASELGWSLSLSRTERSIYHLSYLESLTVSVDSVAITDRIERGCQPDPDVFRTSMITPNVHLSELVTVQVSAALAPAADGTSLRPCQSALDPGRLSFTTQVPRSDLFGEGVTISAPDGGEYHFSLTLRAF